ncbi:MAG: hypothetical protein Q9160_005817 [Pyrenula sp. 1 TL-2023]
MLVKSLLLTSTLVCGLSRPSTSLTFPSTFLFQTDNDRILQRPVESSRSSPQALTGQSLVMNIPPFQPSQPGKDPEKDPTGPITISDILPRLRSINIFASLTRDIEPISDRLSSHKEYTTVLAPLNSAIQSLPRKPWEDPEDYAALGERAYSGEDGGQRAARNLKRFVEAHAIEGRGFEEEEGRKITTIGGGEVWWVKGKEGEKKLMPGDIKVKEVVTEVGNGEIWILEGVMNYSRQ